MSRYHKISKDYAANIYIKKLEELDGKPLDEPSVGFLKEFFEIHTDSPGKTLYYELLDLYRRGYKDIYIKFATRRNLKKALIKYKAPDQIINHAENILLILLRESKRAFLKKLRIVHEIHYSRPSVWSKFAEMLKNVLKRPK